MTETTDPVRALVDALPRHARAQLHITQAISGNIHAAVRDHGWTVAQLVAECSRNLDVINPGGAITYRLRHCAEHAPPRPASRTGLAVIPLCGQCEDGYLVDPETRLPVQKCPCRTTKETA